MGVAPEDKIETRVTTYRVNEMDLGGTEVKDVTTRIILSVSVNGNAIGEFMSTFNGETNSETVSNPTLGSTNYAKYFDGHGTGVGVDANGIYQDRTTGGAVSIIGALSEYAAIETTLKSEVTTQSGKEYLKQQALNTKIAKQAAEASAEAQKIKDQQMLNPDRTGTSAEDFGGGI